MLRKIYFALRGNKVIYEKNLFVVTFDIFERDYVIWYIDTFGVPRFFDRCSIVNLVFKWNILMEEKGK